MSQLVYKLKTRRLGPVLFLWIVKLCFLLLLQLWFVSNSFKTILNNILVQRLFLLKTSPSRIRHLPATLKNQSINKKLFSAGPNCCIHFLTYSPPYYGQFWVIVLSASNSRIIKHVVHYSFVWREFPGGFSL